MKISSLPNFKYTNFCAKKKEIKKADDIQRKAKENFPMFSPAYLNEFYILNGKGMDPKQVRTRQIAQRIVYKINAGRDYDDYDARYSIIAHRKETPFIRTLNRIKKDKIGNCHEASIIAMTALAANGYTDAKRASLKLKGEFVNKKTNEVVFSKIYDVDHTFAMTAMNKENPRNNDYIIVDPWLGFADSISIAKQKFAQIVNPDKHKSDLNDAFSLFRVDHFQETGEFLDKSDYDIKFKIIFEEEKEYTKEDIKALGSYARMMFPHLCL